MFLIIEHTVSQSLAPAHQEVAGAIREEKIVNVDETGHKERNNIGWCWLTSTMKYTCFFLRRSRGKKVAKEIIPITPQDANFNVQLARILNVLSEKNRSNTYSIVRFFD